MSAEHGIDHEPPASRWRCRRKGPKPQFTRPSARHADVPGSSPQLQADHPQLPIRPSRRVATERTPGHWVESRRARPSRVVHRPPKRRPGDHLCHHACAAVGSPNGLGTGSPTHHRRERRPQRTRCQLSLGERAMNRANLVKMRGRRIMCWLIRAAYTVRAFYSARLFGGAELWCRFLRATALAKD